MISKILFLFFVLFWCFPCSEKHQGRMNPEGSEGAASACSSVGVDKIHPSMCSSTDKTFGSPRSSLFCRPECLWANICGETPRFLCSAGGLLFPLQSWEDKRPTRKHNPSDRRDHGMHRGICISKDGHKRAGTDVAEESDMNTVRFLPTIQGFTSQRETRSRYTCNHHFHTTCSSDAMGEFLTLENKCGSSQWMFVSRIIFKGTSWI